MSKNKNKDLAKELVSDELIANSEETPEESGIETPEETPEENGTGGGENEITVTVDEVPQRKKVYKCLHTGTRKFPIGVRTRSGEEIKRYATFNNGTLLTEDAEEIEALDALIKKEQRLKVPIRNRMVLTEDEYTASVKPERLFVEIDGKDVHISDLRKAYQFAIENGMEFGNAEIVVVKPKSKVSRGGTSAGAGGI